MFTADAAPNTHCAVAPLAAEAVRLIRQRRLYDQNNADALLDAVDARLDRVQEAASLGHATSREGLFFQVCLISAMLDAVKPVCAGQEPGMADARTDIGVADSAIFSLGLGLFSEADRVLADHYLPQAFKMAMAA